MIAERRSRQSATWWSERTEKMIQVVFFRGREKKQPIKKNNNQLIKLGTKKSSLSKEQQNRTKHFL